MIRLYKKVYKRNEDIIIYNMNMRIFLYESKYEINNNFIRNKVDISRCFYVIPGIIGFN